jgi:hypothetical protein
MHDLDACLAIDPAYGNCLRWKALTAAFMGDDALALALYERGVATGSSLIAQRRSSSAWWRAAIASRPCC